MPEPKSDISLRIIQAPLPQTVWSATEVPRLMAGLGISVVIGLIGWRRGSLSASGFAGAIVTGTITTVAGGYGRAFLLVGFFAASSALSRLPATTLVDVNVYAAKGTSRDVKQVLANGGVSTGITMPGSNGGNLAAYVGSLAAATGDTWATEIGSRVGGQPWHILTRQPVTTGYSGGVTGAGFLGSAAGGAFIGALAELAGYFDPTFRERGRSLLVTGVLSGVLGSLADSLIGATLQERRFCDQCGNPTESPVHTCGHPTRIIGGIPGFTNDGVNVLCTVVGAVTGWTLDACTPNQ